MPVRPNAWLGGEYTWWLHAVSASAKTSIFMPERHASRSRWVVRAEFARYCTRIGTSVIDKPTTFNVRGGVVVPWNVAVTVTVPGWTLNTVTIPPASVAVCDILGPFGSL